MEVFFVFKALFETNFAQHATHNTQQKYKTPPPTNS